MARRGDSAPADAPSTLNQSLGMALIAAGRLAQRTYEAELAETGLSLRHLGALGHLAHDPDLSISDLARRSGVTAQSMHATVRGLEERDAVRSQDQGRGRPARLTVTDHGRELLSQSRLAARRLDAALTEQYGADKAAALRTIFGLD